MFRNGFIFKERVSIKNFSIFATYSLAVILGFVVIVETTALVYLTMNKKIFIQPPFIVSKTMEADYEHGELHKEFLNHFVLKFIAYTENLTPDNAEVNSAKIKTYLSSAFHTPYSRVLKKRVRNLKDTGSIRSFHISTIDISKEGEILIKGVRMITNKDTVILNERRSIIISYKLSNTDGFQLINVSEREK